MRKIYKNIVRIIFLILTITSAICCSDNGGTEDPISSQMVTGFSLLSGDIYVGQNIIVEGVGYKVGDIINFKSVSNQFEAPISAVEQGNCSVIIPEGFVSNSYTVTLKRGNNIQILGSIIMTVVPVKSVSDKTNSTIKGKVFCENTPIQGVRVSDGIVTTETDQDGCYWLNSAKLNGYVFISLPGGYEPADKRSKTMPKFWSVLRSGKSTCEQHDFELLKVDNRKHIVVVATDLHLANRSTVTNDLTQFNNGFVNDVKQFVYTQGTTPVYTITLGDLAWDEFWYANNYDIDDYRKTMETYYPTMVFNTMGNHDNNAYQTGDFNGEKAYKAALGPTYYSMNIGNVHYIILDNTEWVNTGGAEGVVGSRNYTRNISDTQLNWVLEDLAAISDKETPIVIGLHCNTHSNYNATFSNTQSYSSANTDALYSKLSGFSNVHVLSGHTHYNANMILSNTIMHHNTAAVCETWWWSGKLTSVSVCKDGTPAGYGVYEINDRDISWYYKSIGKAKTKQFRSYDMNKVKEFFSQTSVQTQLAKYPDRKGEGNDYKSVGDNVGFINIWNYDPQWQISVKENNVGLAVDRVYEKDPFHTICFDYPRVNFDNNTNTDFSSIKNSHMFQVKTNNAASTLQIKVTDRFGNVYEETMVRPKNFNTSSD